MDTIEHKEFVFKTQTGDNSAEIISLISQVMHSYEPRLAVHEHDAIAAWFFRRYSITGKINPSGD